MAITMEELRRKAKAYDVALERAKEIVNNQNASSIWKDWLRNTFPELKNEDERVRKELIELIGCMHDADPRKKGWIAWLEKQVPIDEDKIVKGVRRGVAISLMNHIDANSKGMCLSNMECEDIENAIINEDWDKVYGYMKKKLTQQEVTKISDQEKDFIEIHFGAKDSEFIGDTYFIPEGCYAVIVGDEVVIKKGEKQDEPTLKAEQSGMQTLNTWSEEDESILNNLIAFLKVEDELKYDWKQIIVWLESLKQRIGG